LNPRELLDAHRVYDPTFTALFYEPGSTESASKDDGKWFFRASRAEHPYINCDLLDLLPYVGIDPTHNALVYKAIRSEDDDFSMRMSLLNK
jgi:translation initiation factor eIF-2B subunit gamma